MREMDATEQAYKNGFAAGMKAAEEKIVRCDACIHRAYFDMGDDIGAIGGCALFGHAMSCNDFCSYGERRADNV